MKNFSIILFILFIITFSNYSFSQDKTEGKVELTFFHLYYPAPGPDETLYFCGTGSAKYNGSGVLDYKYRNDVPVEVASFTNIPSDPTIGVTFSGHMCEDIGISYTIQISASTIIGLSNCSLGQYHTAQVAGIDNIKTDHQGTATFRYYVRPPNIPTVSKSSEGLLCVGDEITLTANPYSLNGRSHKYYWKIKRGAMHLKDTITTSRTLKYVATENDSGNKINITVWSYVGAGGGGGGEMTLLNDFASDVLHGPSYNVSKPHSVMGSTDGINFGKVPGSTSFDVSVAAPTINLSDYSEVYICPGEQASLNVTWTKESNEVVEFYWALMKEDGNGIAYIPHNSGNGEGDLFDYVANTATTPNKALDNLTTETYKLYVANILSTHTSDPKAGSTEIENNTYTYFGCYDMKTISVVEYPELEPTITPTDTDVSLTKEGYELNCFNSDYTFNLSASGGTGGDYEWSVNGRAYEPLTDYTVNEQGTNDTRTITFQLKDKECELETVSSFTIDEKVKTTIYNIELSNSLGITCESNPSINITPNGYATSWSYTDPFGTQTTSASNWGPENTVFSTSPITISGDNYSVTIHDSLGCPSTTSIDIPRAKRVRFKAGSVTASKYSGSYDLSCNPESISYKVENYEGGTSPDLTVELLGSSLGEKSSTTGSYSIEVEGIYTLKVTDNLTGCTMDYATGLGYESTTPDPEISFTTLSTEGVGAEQYELWCDNPSLTLSINEQAIKDNSSNYTFNWSVDEVSVPSTTEYEFTNITTQGTYQLSITDKSTGCESTEITQDINKAPEIALDNLTPTSTHAGGYHISWCENKTAGITSSLSTAGSGSYSYTWTGPTDWTSTATQDLSGLTLDGTYSLQVKDNVYGCLTETKATTLSKSPPITVSPDLHKKWDDGAGTDYHITCLKGTDGQITLNASGGGGSLTYEWWKNNAPISDNTDAISGKTGGIYTYKIVDEDGCAFKENGQTEINLTLNSPEADKYNLRITNLDSTQVTCNENTNYIQGTGNTNNGTITVVSVEGQTIGTNNTEYSLYNSGGTILVRDYQTGTLFSGLSASSTSSAGWTGYRVYVKDPNGCTAWKNIEVYEPAALVFAYDTVGITCKDSGNGQILQSSIGGGGKPDETSYTYLWDDSNVQDTEDATNLQQGNYTVTITDNAGCEVKSPVYEITEPEYLTVTKLESTDITCHDYNDGTMILEITGGTKPYTPGWKRNNSSQTLTPASSTENSFTYNSLLSGNYELLLSDAKGCPVFGTQTASIINPDYFTANYQATNPLCNGGSDGSIILNVSGGTKFYDGKYKFVWTPNGETTKDLTSLSAGTYTVSVTDSNNCFLYDNEIDLNLYTDNIISATLGEPNPLKITIDSSVVTCKDGNDGWIEAQIEGGTTPYNIWWYDYSKSGAEQTIKTESIPTEQGTTKVEDLYANLYGIEILDKNNCPLTATAGNQHGGLLHTINIMEPEHQLQLVRQSDSATCYNYQNGSLQLQAMGGWGANYSFQVSGTKFDETIQSYNQSHNLLRPNSQTLFDNLYSGDYHVTLTDSAGCQIDLDTMVHQPEPLVLNASITENIKCKGEQGGKVHMTATGGTGPFFYQIRDLENNQDEVKSLERAIDYSNQLYANQSYFFDLTDIHNCPADQTTLILTEPATKVGLDADTPFTLSDYNGYQVTQCEEDNGWLKINAVGGTGTYSYQLNENNYQAEPEFNNLFAGLYTINIKDENDCIFSKDIFLSSPNDIDIELTDIVQTPVGESIGELEVAVSGGVSPYQLEWNPTKQTTNRATNLSAGLYYILVKDENNCVELDSFGVSNIGGPEIQLVNTTPPLCFDSNEGTAEIEIISTDYPPYSTEWNDALKQTSTEATNLKDGNYLVQVQDNRGAISFLSVPIVAPDTLEITGQQVINPLCFEESTGSIQLNITGGTTINTDQYSFLLKDKTTSEELSNQTQSQANFINLGAGDYKIEITDANNCFTNFETSLSQPDKLEIETINYTQPLCYEDANGKITFSGKGGTITDTYTFKITNETEEFSNNSGNFNGLESGEYTLSLIDENNCLTTNNFKLNQPDKLQFKTIKPTAPLCYGGTNGSIKLDAIGGVNTSKPYTYRLSNASGLIDMKQSNTEVIFENLISADYLYELEDENGCLTNGAIKITQPEAIAVDFEKQQVSCHNGTDGKLQANVSGGTAPYVYKWYNNQGEHIQNETGNSLNNIPSGLYTVEVWDKNKCPYGLPLGENIGYVDETSMHNPQELKVSALNIVDVSKYGESDGSVSLLAEGGWDNYQYSKDNVSYSPVNVFHSLSAGEHTFYVKDHNGCIATLPVEVKQPEPLEATVEILQEITCNGENNAIIEIQTAGGYAPYTYTVASKNYTENTIHNLTAGNYNIEITDSKQNKTTVNVNITQPELLVTQIASTGEASCNTANGYAEVQVSGGTSPYTYSWSDIDNQATAKADNLSPGSYIVTVTDKKGCISKQNAEIKNASGPTVNLQTIKNTSCSNTTDGEIAISISGGAEPYQINWSHDENVTAQELNNLAQGTYTITVTDANNCSYQSSYDIESPEELKLTAEIKNPTCTGQSNGQIIVSSEGGTGSYSYQWQNQSSTSEILNKLTEGNYTITVTDANQCQKTESYELTDPESVDLNLPDEYTICSGQSIKIQATEITDMQYQWSYDNEIVSTESYVTADHSGTILLETVDNNQCQTSYTIEIYESNDLLEANFTIDSEAMLGDTIALIEISWPKPTGANWSIPSAFEILSEIDNDVIMVARDTGVHYINMTASLGGCMDMIEKAIHISDSITQTNPTEVRGYVGVESLKAYPNPTKGQVTIETQLSEESEVIVRIYHSVYHQTGIVLKGYNRKEYEFEVLLGNYPAGIYIVEIYTGRERKTTRFIKQ